MSPDPVLTPFICQHWVHVDFAFQSGPSQKLTCTAGPATPKLELKATDLMSKLHHHEPDDSENAASIATIAVNAPLGAHRRYVMRPQIGVLNRAAVWMFMASVVGFFGCVISHAAESGSSATSSAVGAIEAIDSPSPEVRDQAIDAILAARKTLTDKLIMRVDPANQEQFSRETRIASVYLLGELRSSEAATVLAKALAQPLDNGPQSDISRYSFPEFSALVKIGRPAVPAMLENVASSDSKVLQARSLDVLLHILGDKRQVLTQLDQFERQHQDKHEPNHDVLRRISKARERVVLHFK